MTAKSKKLSPLRQAVQDTYEDYFGATANYHFRGNIATVNE